MTPAMRKFTPVTFLQHYDKPQLYQEKNTALLGEIYVYEKGVYNETERQIHIPFWQH